MNWQYFRRKGAACMRPYIPGEDLTGVSVSNEDTPALGGMIAKNLDNDLYQWYVAKAYFDKHFEPM